MSAASSFPAQEEGVIKKGLWSPEEDQKLIKYFNSYGIMGQTRWREVPIYAGLARTGRSCRLRWENYLRPDLNREPFSPFEEEIIIALHALLGNKWSTIADHLTGRTDNDIRNHWKSTLRKKLCSQGTDTDTHPPLPGFDSSGKVSSPGRYEQLLSRGNSENAEKFKSCLQDSAFDSSNTNPSPFPSFFHRPPSVGWRDHSLDSYHYLLQQEEPLGHIHISYGPMQDAVGSSSEETNYRLEDGVINSTGLENSVVSHQNAFIHKQTIQPEIFTYAQSSLSDTNFESYTFVTGSQVGYSSLCTSLDGCQSNRRIYQNSLDLLSYRTEGTYEGLGVTADDGYNLTWEGDMQVFPYSIGREASIELEVTTLNAPQIDLEGKVAFDDGSTSLCIRIPDIDCLKDFSIVDENGLRITSALRNTGTSSPLPGFVVDEDMIELARMIPEDLLYLGMMT